MSDIVSEIRKGNRGAFRELFEDYYPVLCSFSRKFIPDEEHCRDVVQDVLLKYWEKRMEYADLPAVRAFLYTAVKNQCFNLIKREQVGERYLENIQRYSEVHIEEEVTEHEIFRLLHQAVGSLPSQMRTIIQHAMEGKRNAEIAREMGIADGTLHTLKKHAYKKLRNQLKEYVNFCIFF